MARQIEALVTSQRRLLRDVSHELRSPLARLSIAAGLARREATEATHSQLDRIEQEAERLNRLIGQLLALARLDGHLDASSWVEFDLSEVVDEVAANGEFEAHARGRTVRVIETAPCTVRGLPDLMRSALENAVRNGIRFTKESQSVDIALRICRNGGERQQAELYIRDHGSGVPEELLPHLFEPFYRVPNASPSSGAGLGLAITRRAVEIHGGAVFAENAAGGGLAVTIAIPLTPEIT